MTDKPAFVFLDIETTGLDPKSDYILELAMITTDRNLNEIDAFAKAVELKGIDFYPTDGRYEPPFGIPQVVVDMHTKNGLWQDCYRTDTSVNQVFTDATFWLNTMLEGDDTLPLCGNTIGFDKSFIHEIYPEFLKNFHYRSVDISSFKILYNEWIAVFGVLEDQIPPGNKLHRALPDCMDSINELRFYRKKLFNG